ncbi:hypothetical protein BGW80DRAFT_1263103 [Lactifluus volemus]|nr:hypothetical protein BGW80DRAFT_1263103 [Lactifluus volemus]
MSTDRNGNRSRTTNCWKYSISMNEYVAPKSHRSQPHGLHTLQPNRRSRDPRPTPVLH